MEVRAVQSTLYPNLAPSGELIAGVLGETEKKPIAFLSRFEELCLKLDRR